MCDCCRDFDLSLDASKVDEARIAQNARIEMAKENQDLREQVQDLQSRMGQFETILKTRITKET